MWKIKDIQKKGGGKMNINKFELPAGHEHRSLGAN